MRKRTTTKQISTAITNNLLTIEKAEAYNKITHKTDKISAESFRESLDFLCETIFANCLGWHYETDIKENGVYIAECGRMDGSVDVIVTVYMRICNGANEEAVERTLLFTEEE